MKRMSLFGRFKKEDKEVDNKEEVDDTLRICYLKRISYLDSEITYLGNMKDKFRGSALVGKVEVESIEKNLHNFGERLSRLCCLLMDDEFRIMANANRYIINTSSQILRSILNLECITGDEMIKCLDTIERLLRVDLFRAKDRVDVK